MGWKQALRSLEASRRRADREAQSRRRQVLRQQEIAYRMAERARAANDAALYENFVESLTTLHKDVSTPINWTATRAAPEPQFTPPPQKRTHEAQAAIAAFKPGFFAKLFGSATRTRAALEDSLEAARRSDEADLAKAQAEHQGNVAWWNRCRTLAAAVLDGLPDAAQEVLAEFRPFEDLDSFGIRVNLRKATSGCVAVDLEIQDPDIVPRDEVKLTAGGKLSEKPLTDSKYWTIYQDFVCSAALRCANELFALLPIDRAIVNACTSRLNTATGHPQLDCILALHATRTDLQRINLERIDPSDAMKNFQVRMKFKKSTGFDNVEPITLDEQWVTT